MIKIEVEEAIEILNSFANLDEDIELKQAIEAIKKDREELLKHRENLILCNNEFKALIEEYSTNVRIKELEEADLTTVYIKGVYDEKGKWRDRIKEKIEELEKMTKDESKYFIYTNYRYTMNILQELLKESE